MSFIWGGLCALSKVPQEGYRNKKITNRPRHRRRFERSMYANSSKKILNVFNFDINLRACSLSNDRVAGISFKAHLYIYFRATWIHYYHLSLTKPPTVVDELGRKVRSSPRW